MLNALLVTYGRILVRRAGPRLRWIFATIAVHLVEMLGLRVIRLELVVADGPCGRDSAMMPNLTEVFFTQSKERSAVELRVTANEIIRVRVQLFAFAIAPRLFRVVSRFEVYGARAPVVLLAWNIVAAFQDQDLLARGREFVGQRAATRARADDDYDVVIVAGHDHTPRLWSYCAFTDSIDCIAEFNGAVPKFTLKRLHQIVTARYLERSAFAGSS